MQKLLTTLCASLLVGAASPSIASSGAAALKAELERTYPNTPISEVRESPIPGLYQVTMGRTVAFADRSGRYFVFGPMFDMVEQVDLTAEARDSLSRTQWDDLPLNLAFQVKRGDGSRHFAVFTDPDCPFCRRLERELEGIDNFTMHVFLNPIDAMHPHAREKSEGVWCAEDRNAAWSKLMIEGVVPPAARCPNPLDEIADLARKMRVAGTPSLVRDDGAFKAGFMAAPALDAWLNQSAVRR